MQAASESRGQLLWTLLQDTISRMGGLPDRVRAAAIAGYLDKRTKLIDKLENMSEDGRIKMGKFLQSEARKQFDTNMAEGYALWLAGAWLESMQRPGAQAAMTHQYLESMAREFEPLLDET
ncbi:MAG TPA: hypothetical protein VF193_04245 [Steroidobacter sp.]